MDQDSIKPLRKKDVRVFCGNSNRPLASAIANALQVPLSGTSISRFSNDNLYIQLGDSVRSRRVYIVQSLSPPVNDHLLELLMMIDIAKGAGASEVHAIIPYYSVARSDKKNAPRISILARLVADLLVTAGATHIMTMQLHSPQVHGFFSVPTDPLTARPIFQAYYRDEPLDGTIVVAPDAGGAKSAYRFARELNVPMATGNKERLSDTEVHIGEAVGRAVRGFRHAIIYDDEISTGSSVVELSNLLIANGIETIDVMATHGVFVGSALQKLDAVPQIRRVIVTDTVEHGPEIVSDKLTVLSVASIFAEAISRNAHRKSIGDLFVFWER